MKDQPTNAPKHPRGRPVEYVVPAPIPDTPENIAKVIFSGSPKKQYRFTSNPNWRRK